MKTRSVFGALTLSLMVVASPAIAAPAVVASIKPVHALVSAVMDGVGTPDLLVSGNASPHTYSLRPSDAAALQNADIVFWTGHGMELFLEDALDSLAPQARSVALSEVDGITLLPVRDGGAFEPHVHEGEAGHDHEGHDHSDDHDGHDHGDHGHEAHDHEGHDHEDHADHEGEEHAHDHADAHDHDHDHAHGGGDMHFWLDPQNAAMMVAAIAETLSELDSENAARYAANAEAEIAELGTLTETLAERLAPIADIPFLVFHDAYQYFEARFGLTVAGSVTVTPDIMPGAQRVNQLRARVAESGAACIFAEPQFEPAIIAAIAEGSDLRTGVLDPEGAALEPGAGLYAELLEGLADDLVACLSAAAP